MENQNMLEDKMTSEKSQLPKQISTKELGIQILVS